MIRKATIDDVKAIQQLINFYAKQDRMLSRPLNELYENIRDFFVYEENGEVLGCSALHIAWEELAEVKSLAVEESEQNKGIGSKLLSASLDEAKSLKAKRVFVLTYIPDFFKKFGFKEIAHSELPHKIWNECIRCVKFPDCDENALMIDL